MSLLNPCTYSLQIKASLFTKYSFFLSSWHSLSKGRFTAGCELWSKCQRKWDEVKGIAPLNLLVSFKLIKAIANNSIINLKGGKKDGDKEQEMV